MDEQQTEVQDVERAEATGCAVQAVRKRLQSRWPHRSPLLGGPVRGK